MLELTSYAKACGFQLALVPRLNLRRMLKRRNPQKADSQSIR